MKYKPISCSLYDRIESLAVLKKSIRIIFINDDKTEEIIDGQIKNVFSRDNAEFLLINNSEIRLDQIKSISENEGENEQRN